MLENKQQIQNIDQQLDSTFKFEFSDKFLTLLQQEQQNSKVLHQNLDSKFLPPGVAQP